MPVSGFASLIAIEVGAKLETQVNAQCMLDTTLQYYLCVQTSSPAVSTPGESLGQLRGPVVKTDPRLQGGVLGTGVVSANLC